MKKFFYMAVAAIAALSSCSDDNDAILGEGGKQSDGVASFTATIESDATTRTTIADGTGTNKKVLWSDGDAVSINGVNYTTSLSSASETATFTTSGTAAQTIEGKYKAIYPTAYSSGTGSNIVYRLPAVHAYSDGFNMPMYAEGTTTDLAFKNLCGVLAVTVKNISGIKAVRVISTTEDVEAPMNTKLSGEFTVAMSGGGDPVMTMSACNSNQVTINCGDGVDADASTGKVFYFPLPPATYDSLQVVVESETNTVAHMTSGDSPIIARNKIYNITFDGSKHNGRNNVLPIYATTKSAAGNPTAPVKCVTLWSGSPIFATINVGQTVTNYASINTPVTDENKTTVYSTANVGGLYHWGGTINRRDNTGDNDYSSSTTDIAGTADDTAMKLWGPIWRMPTKAELNHLRNYKDDSSAALAMAVTTWTKCDGQTGDGHAQYVTGCTLFGYKVAGKGDFSGNSVFLPLAGSKDYIYGNVSSQGQCAFYRSTTPSSASGYALSLNFSSTSSAPSVCVDEISSFSSVRAVLK